MKRSIQLALVLAVILCTPVVAQAPLLTYSSNTSVQAIIASNSALYEVSTSSLEIVASCESKLVTGAYNPDDDGSPSYGLYQFKRPTFLTYAKQAGIVSPDIWNVNQQAQVAAYMFHIGQARQWSCARKLLYL